ncbi:MAG: peptidoglycan DD-metalloendopeptidase family protein [Rhizomicrobium sp.]
MLAGAVLLGAADTPPASLRHHTPPTAQLAGVRLVARNKDDKSPDPDLSGAVPASAIDKLPSTATQVRSLRSTIAQQKPELDDAQKSRDALADAARLLHQKLVDTAARIQGLEAEKLRLDREIPRLTAENAKLSAGFAKDRRAVARLVATLERLQHTLPPAMVLKSDDALGAARAAMMMGATLPDIYKRAAVLAKRIEHTRAVRETLIARRREAAANSMQMARAEGDLTRLLSVRQAQAAGAAAQYDTLKKKFDEVASRAASLQMLLDETSVLRNTPAAQGIVTVTAQGTGGATTQHLIHPVAGDARPGGVDGVGGADAPGQTFTTLSGAQVVAPADASVLFAGSYQKTGLVLILELANGYDAVLAGLGRIDVHLGDRVLAGEPVGKMPAGAGQPPSLYLELRHNGRGINPAPFFNAGSRKAKRP